MERIAWLTNTHLSPGSLESCSLWPRHMERLSRLEAIALCAQISRGTGKAFNAAERFLGKEGPWSFIGHLGNAVNGWQGHGCHHPEVRPIAERIVAELRAAAPDCEIRFALGGRDIADPSSSTLPIAEICPASIAACKEIFGPLCWTHQLSGLTILGVRSPLAAYEGRDPTLIALQQEQREFVRRTLHERKERGDAWILAAHSFATPRDLAREIAGHEGDLLAFVCGDFHDPRKFQFLRAFAIRTSWRRAVRIAYQRSVLCPSVAPLWCRGYGMLTMTWDPDTRRLGTTPVTLLRSRDVETLPTESFWRCAWWMLF